MHNAQCLAHCKSSALKVGARLRRVFLSVLNEAIKAAEYLSGVADENKKWDLVKSLTYSEVSKSRDEEGKSVVPSSSAKQ